ncbi:signal peptide peptidase SppA [Ornithinibacillus sp. L9]|uniref:Signal peptide peptidase SppA n=1 Tax=Ornithinibacillus caprae TaxID=2678566 RepID=A0A6N8FGR0_9BACI|nr:signal peptide peptidase SppA [Ornithinibacillus caprae]MUK88842.1 signal peptide peptidase SppA [Ornithinibacillus caprae]
MNAKRWYALLAAAVLLIVSVGFQFISSFATSNFEQIFALQDKKFNEEVIEEGLGNKIVVLHLDGVIQDTAPSTLINTTSYNHKRFLEMLEEAGEDRSVDGIILRINTPGGGVVESAEIHDKIVDIQEEYNKPIYVSMGNTAASGGYYISAPANKVVAHPATLTGSIGVIMEGYDLSGLAEELGVEFNTIKSGEFKDIMSISREMTDEERELLQTMIDDMYDDFVQVIVDGRDMSEATVRQLGDGRVYTGRQAQENGLVDELGSLQDAISIMSEDYEWNDVQVVRYNNQLGFEQFLGMSMQSLFAKETEFFSMMDMIRESNAPRAMYLYSN